MESRGSRLSFLSDRSFLRNGVYKAREGIRGFRGFLFIPVVRATVAREYSLNEMFRCRVSFKFAYVTGCKELDDASRHLRSN